jgi:predicted  nucleic acid-binding Zn-ribbon protein
MTTTITLIDHTQPKADWQRPALSFDTSQFAGQHDADVQARIDSAKSALSRAARQFEIAKTAIKTRNSEKLLETWKALQPVGRKLTDAIAVKHTQLAGVDVTARSMDNTLRSARMAVNEAKNATLPKRPTETEIDNYDGAIAKAEARLAEIKASVQKSGEHETRIKGELKQLQTELVAFEKEEADVVQKYRAITGKTPGRVPQVATAVQSADGLSAN